MLVHILAILAFCFCCSLTHAVEIPMSAIFGHHIEGAQPIKLLARGKFDKDGNHQMTAPSPVTEFGNHLVNYGLRSPKGLLLKAQHNMHFAQPKSG